MTQDELKLSKYNEEKALIETNQKNLSRYRIEEHLLLNRLKQNRKLLNACKLKKDRIEKFEKLLEFAGVLPVAPLNYWELYLIARPFPKTNKDATYKVCGCGRFFPS